MKKKAICPECNEQFEFASWKKKKYCGKECYQSFLRSNRWDNPMNHQAIRDKLSKTKTGVPNPVSYRPPQPHMRGDGNPSRQPGVGNKISTGLRKFYGPIDNDFIRYKRNVMLVTRRQPVETLDNSEKRGVWGNDKYHLDHIVSIKEGYLRNIDYTVIGDIKNLQFITCYENNAKGAKLKL